MYVAVLVLLLAGITVQHSSVLLPKEAFSCWFGSITSCYEPNAQELGVQCLGILYCLTRMLPPEVGDSQDKLDRCTYVTRYLDIRSLVFSETLQLDRA